MTEEQKEYLLTPEEILDILKPWHKEMLTKPELPEVSELLQAQVSKVLARLSVTPDDKLRERVADLVETQVCADCSGKGENCTLCDLDFRVIAASILSTIIPPYEARIAQARAEAFKEVKEELEKTYPLNQEFINGKVADWWLHFWQDKQP